MEIDNLFSLIFKKVSKLVKFEADGFLRCGLRSHGILIAGELLCWSKKKRVLLF